MTDWAKEIEEELNWREAELASFKALISFAPKGSVRMTALLRALWALLYAHYEGFCKFLWDFYLDALEKQKIQREICEDRIACLSLEKDFKKLKSNLAPESIWSFCKSEFPQLIGETAVFHTKLDTQNNLWPGIFRKNTEKVALPTKMIDEQASKIKTLVARRNEIAHGRKMVIRDLSEYQKYEESTLLVMHDLAVSIFEAIERQQYLK